MLNKSFGLSLLSTRERDGILKKYPVNETVENLSLMKDNHDSPLYLIFKASM